MERARLLELVEMLGREFERLGETTKVETLRLYYLAVLRGLDHRGSVKVAWDEEMTIEWFGMLRLPPYERLYSVHPRDYVCPCPGGGGEGPSGRPGDWSHIGKGTALTERTFPGGARLRCGCCEARWLILDEKAPGGTAASTIRPPA